jgi:Na+-transporting methylmalonyl-CoA/oxaloacetate decarboxylase gamma subunit
MRPELLLGLQISLTGLAVTFLALGLLILIMRLILLLFSPVSRFSQPEPPAEGMDEQQRQETAVALAVSVYLLEQHEKRPERDPSLGKLLEE